MSSEPPGTFEICPVYFWEDDNFQAANPKFAGGANEVNLEEARRNFQTFGASSREFIKRVRKPRPEEMPEGTES